MGYTERVELYKELEKMRGSKILTFVTGDRQGAEAQIHSDVIPCFADHLDILFEKSNKISLYMYSLGGVITAGWSIINLIRMFCDELEIILPSKALSTATLMCIGADRIIMTKQATLGPIDPSTNGPFNPQFPINGSGQTVPMSVEYLSGYLDLARETIGEERLVDAFMRLSETVHPLALGNAYRIRRQIKMLAKRMLQHHLDDEEKIEKIIAFLCSDSGSHDYTINRREAADKLGLPAQNPTAEEYVIIKAIHADISDELKLTEPFNVDIELGPLPSVNYSMVHGLLESVEGGCHRNLTEGLLSINTPPNLPSNQVTYRGWKHGWT